MTAAQCGMELDQSEPPEKYYCEVCLPRQVSTDKARMIQKRFFEFDMSGENTVYVDNDGPHFAHLDAEVKQKPESEPNYLTGSRIEGQPTESRGNPVCAVCHRHFALNASGLVRIHGQKLNRCPGSWQAPIFNSSFQDRSTLPPAPDPSLNQASLARSHVKYIKRIHRAARTNAARIFASIIEEVIALNDETSWNRLFLFTPRCLRAPPRGGIRWNVTGAINNQIREESDHLPTIPKRGKQNKRSLTDPLFFMDLVASVPTNVVPSISVTEANVAQAIRSFPNANPFFAGPDGLRPKHLKDMTVPSAGDTGLQLLKSLICLMNLILNGYTPQKIRPLFFGANLFAIEKPDGGIRPIAVGCTIRDFMAAWRACRPSP